MHDDRSALTRRWLQRLAFSFFVVAFFLAWDAYKRFIAHGGAVNDWRMVLEGIAAGMSMVLGVLGLRERHRSR